MCGQKNELKALSLTISGGSSTFFFFILIPDIILTPGQWSVMWPNWEQLGAAKPPRSAGVPGVTRAAQIPAWRQNFPKSEIMQMLSCSVLFPRCITIPRGPHRRRCAQLQMLTAALFQPRVAEGEEDAHCGRHKLSIVQSGVKRRAPLLFELSHTEWSLLERRKKKGRQFKGRLRA